jgi:hypothetical protein
MSETVPHHSSRRRRLAGVALVAVLAAVLVAVVVARSGGEKIINAGGETLVLVGEKTDGGMDALGSGKLADVGGCLGWAPTGSDEGTVVIWPHGTNVETPDPLRVRIKGEIYAIGDTVEVGGGHVGPLEPSGYFYDQVPKSCRTADVFVANEG